MTRNSEDDARRAARRAFIRTSHPDAGGDADRFIAGLAAFDPPAPAPVDRRPTVYRSRRPDRVVGRTLRTLRRRLRGQPARRLR
jgi:hypothetical protein